MRSVNLLPYCPLPVDSGGKTEMWKHLEVLKALGDCRILSAAEKPVGSGWSAENRNTVEGMGYKVELREDDSRRNMMQYYGIAYASVCKGLGMEKAFGHSNPYHRHAFSQEWFYKKTESAELAVINYSYWSWLKCRCPKVIVLLDLWSDYMWEGMSREIEDLGTASMIIVISVDEEKKLHDMGLKNTFWSPPAVKKQEFAPSGSVCMVGSCNQFNREGLKWLESATSADSLNVDVFGKLSDAVSKSNFRKVGRYKDTFEPYRDNGILLMPSAGGMGVQIKTIEALASGRVIVARKGAEAWIEVEKPEEMVEAAMYLKGDEQARLKQSELARGYYDEFLDSDRIRSELKSSYQALV